MRATFSFGKRVLARSSRFRFCVFARQKRTKTYENVADKGENVFIDGKRAQEMRKRFLPRETTQAKAKNVSRANTRLYTENALTGGKVVYRAKTSLGKRRFASENVARKVGNSFTFLAKAKTRLPSENVPRKGEKAFTEGKRAYRAKPRSRSENVARKVSKAFTGRKFTSEMPKIVYRAKASLANAKLLYRAKTALANAKPVLPSENNVCKFENAFTERKSDKRAKTE